MSMKAIEVSGHIDERSALDVVGPSRVKVITLVPEDAEAGETEWLQAAASNPAFEFLHDA